MKTESVLIAGMDTAAFAAAMAAVRTACPSAATVRVAGLAEAVEREWRPRGEILVLLRPSFAELLRATMVRNPRGLPRWPVVAFGEGPAPRLAQVVCPEDWDSGVGARLLPSAVALHELASENELLRGDLQTLGRRVSHDVRTPLASASAAGEALGGSSPEARGSRAALAGALLKSVAEIAALVERVSFVLRATADPPQRQPVIMGEVVWAALQRLKARTEKARATIVEPESWPHIEGRASWLEVIWENIIGNALDHGGPAPQIELGWVRDSAEFLFRVRDRGRGVPVEKRALLFRPFDLLHELDAPRGLGLPIVHRLVEMQGGRCFYESPAGGGACFYFALPAAAAPARATA